MQLKQTNRWRLDAVINDTGIVTDFFTCIFMALYLMIQVNTVQEFFHLHNHDIVVDDTDEYSPRLLYLYLHDTIVNYTGEYRQRLLSPVSSWH